MILNCARYLLICFCAGFTWHGMSLMVDDDVSLAARVNVSVVGFIVVKIKFSSKVGSFLLCFVMQSCVSADAPTLLGQYVIAPYS